MTLPKAALVLLPALLALPLAGCSGEKSVGDQVRALANAAKVESISEVILGNGTVSIVFERDGAYYEGYASKGELSTAPLDLMPSGLSSPLDALELDAWSRAVEAKAEQCPDALLGRAFIAPSGALVHEAGCRDGAGVGTVQTLIDGAERTGGAVLVDAATLDGVLEDARAVFGEELADLQLSGDGASMSALITGAPRADGCLPEASRTSREGSVEIAPGPCTDPIAEYGVMPIMLDIGPDAVNGAGIVAALERAGAGDLGRVQELDLGRDESDAVGVRWSSIDGTNGFAKL